MSFATALVTGASGFIGRALVTHLRENGKRVVALGRRASTLPPAERQIKLGSVSMGAIAGALGGESVDVVFHCAAYGVDPQDRDPARMFETNVVATGTWVEAAGSVGAKAFVYAGYKGMPTAQVVDCANGKKNDLLPGGWLVQRGCELVWGDECVIATPRARN